MAKKKQHQIHKQSIYNGVYGRDAKWRAFLDHRHKKYALGTYESERHAAYAVDLARFLCYGLDEKNWHYNAKCTNFGLIDIYDFPRPVLLRCLVLHNIMPINELRQKLDVFDVCIKNMQTVPNI